MSGVFMEQEDFIRAKDAEIASLREELQLARYNVERLEGEVSDLYRAAQQATRENLDLRQRLQAFYDEADAEIQLAALRRAEAEALEL
jgi:predicted RNase H-like nuclease (RuvC/YqgF family)